MKKKFSNQIDLELQRLIGKRVRRLREEMGLTREQLAELAELSPQNIAKIEAGDKFLSSGALARLASSLRVEPADLFEKLSKIPSDGIAIKNLIDRCSKNQRKLVKGLIQTVLKSNF